MFSERKRETLQKDRFASLGLLSDSALQSAEKLFYFA